MKDVSINGSTLLTLALFFTIAVAAFSLGGCSSIIQKLGSNDFAVRLTIQYGTMKYIEDDSGSLNKEKAYRVATVAKEMDEYLEQDLDITIDEVNAFLMENIDWSEMSEADAFAARMFIAFLAEELKIKASKGDHPELNEIRMGARQIINTVISTLTPYI